MVFVWPFANNESETNDRIFEECVSAVFDGKAKAGHVPDNCIGNKEECIEFVTNRLARAQSKDGSEYGTAIREVKSELRLN